MISCFVRSFDADVEVGDLKKKLNRGDRWKTLEGAWVRKMTNRN